MAGHSKFKNIMHRKSAQDKKRGKLFSRLIREVTVAAQSGMADPEKNPRLRAAITAAQAANMPKETIARAIKRGSGSEGDSGYEDIRYEGYGPGGVAIIVEALSDNRNRTAADIRAIFSKHGGNLGEMGSVSHAFTRVGSVVFPARVADADTVFEAALDLGASDVESEEETHEIFCDVDLFLATQTALEARFGPAQSAGLIWKPLTLVPVDEAKAPLVLKLIDALDQGDDVQSVAANYDISDAILETILG